MAESILRTALRLQSTRDALLFGKTLSREERSELHALVELLRYFNNYVEKENIKLKISFRIQFINEAIEFSKKETREPFKKLEETYPAMNF